MRVDLDFNVCYEGDQSVRLTPTEAELLAILTKRVHRVVRYPTVLIELFGMADRSVNESNLLKVYCCKLRKKIKPFGWQISAVWGIGIVLHDGRVDHLVYKH